MSNKQTKLKSALFFFKWNFVHMWHMQTAEKKEIADAQLLKNVPIILHCCAGRGRGLDLVKKLPFLPFHSVFGYQPF